ncbi:MAG: HD domain-containing protein [Anaerolineae bacterium]|nr:HD domain-containing protein [Anaerolineae bacterium]
MREEVPAVGKSWREAVREAAHKAAIHEEETWRGGTGLAFNYRWEHVRAVVRLAVRLAERTGADREVVEAAAWLHDVAKGESRDHGRDGAVLARRILAETDYPPDKVDAVAEAIAKHAGTTTPEPVEPLEAAVVWDADKLSKLGATVAIHGIGYRLQDGEGTTEGLIERSAGLEWQEQIVRSLNTAPARAAGWKRLEAARAFYRQAKAEFNGEDL